MFVLKINDEETSEYIESSKDFIIDALLDYFEFCYGSIYNKCEDFLDDLNYELEAADNYEYDSEEEYYDNIIELYNDAVDSITIAFENDVNKNDDIYEKKLIKFYLYGIFKSLNNI